MTPRQLQVLEALHQFHRRNGYPPTVRELCDIVGVASTGTMQTHLEKLVAQGLVERAGGRWLRPTLLGLSALNRPKVAA